MNFRKLQQLQQQQQQELETNSDDDMEVSHKIVTGLDGRPIQVDVDEREDNDDNAYTHNNSKKKFMENLYP
jgi:hypothetical protein